MDRFKGLMLFLLLSLQAPVVQELHEYLSKTQAASLALCLQHTQWLVARLACHCVFLRVLIYFFGLDETDMLLCASSPPFLCSPCLPCSYRRLRGITVGELTVTGSPTVPADSPLLLQSSGLGTGIS